MSPLIIMLLASAGPLIVGLIGMNDDPADDSFTDQDDMAEDPSDPVAMVDVGSFIENARTQTGDPTDLDASRGTDEDAIFVADDAVSTVHDASGGNDQLSGSTFEDTLIGGDGEDTIAGGDGDDALFGGFQRMDRADDAAADSLDGGAGDDTLFLGDDDTGSGGAGSDVFATVRDAAGTIVITDFDIAEDGLAVETDTPDETTVTEQSVDDQGLLVQLSNGLGIRLEGVTEPLPEGAIQFVQALPPADDDALVT